MKQNEILNKIEVKSNQEDLFLTGMIISDDFLKGIAHVMEPQYFKSPHVRTVCKWVLDYYVEHDKAPGSYIQDIFDVESRNTSLPDQELIERLLITISTKYKNKPFNSGYLLPKMIEYIRERVVEICLEDAQWNLKRKGPSEAWEILNKIKEVREKTPKGFSFFRDFSKRFDNWYYANKREIMRFPGALGHYMAPLIRKKLIAYMGKPKGGKSWWLLYTAYIASTFRLNVAFFSLEMSEEEVEERLATMLAAAEFGSGKKTYKIPVMDCYNNQDGSCVKSICRNPGESILVSDKPPLYEMTPHIVCTECRKNWDEEDAADIHTDYEFASWMEEIEKIKLSPKEIEKRIEQFKLHFGEDTLKIFTYRISTATIADMEEDLDHVEKMENWVPDVVIVDYADIAQKNQGMSERRHQLSDIWEQLSGLAKYRNVLCFTASQGNRGAATKVWMGAEDIAEDYGKVMIVDGLIAINEDNTKKHRQFKDKYWQRQQLKWIAHRYKKDIKDWECCTVLNNLTLGQVALDSEITQQEKDGPDE